MMRGATACARTGIGLLLGGVLVLAAPPARAAEDCIACKYRDCLVDTLDQKVQLQSIYRQMAREFEQADGPAQTVDLMPFAEGRERNQAYNRARKRLDDFTAIEDQRTSVVPAPPRCPQASTTEVSTDTFAECKVDAAQLAAAQAEAGCKQLGELLAKHENSHVAACQQRKQAPLWNYAVEGVSVNRVFPSVMLTPAGKANDEAAGYDPEIQGIARLVKAIDKKKCKRAIKGASIDCTVPSPMGKVVMRDEIAGQTCGGDPVPGNWQMTVTRIVTAPMIGTQRKVDPPFDNDCVAKGSAEEARRAALYANSSGARGWMCVYDAKGGRGTPTVTIRNFRLDVCKPATEQAVTVPVSTGECEDDTPPPREPTPQPQVPVS